MAASNQALNDTIAGTFPGLTPLAVLAAYALVFTTLSSPPRFVVRCLVYCPSARTQYARRALDLRRAEFGRS